MRSFYRARVEVMHGERKISDLLAAADLGVTGCGVREILTIDFHPKEIVDDDRIHRLMSGMIQASEETEIKIFNYTLLDIVVVEYEAKL